MADRSGVIYDRSFVPDGWEQPEGNVELGQEPRGHMYWPDRNYRAGWNNEPFRDFHYTDQDIPKTGPDRHRDPRG